MEVSSLDIKLQFYVGKLRGKQISTGIGEGVKLKNASRTLNIADKVADASLDEDNF